MRRHLRLFVTAARFDLVEHARNRLAMVLVALFIPSWISLAYAVIPSRTVTFRLRATGRLLEPAGNQITQITGAINAVTLITGFMMFAITFNGGRFDRRLAMAGYPRIHLVLAKTTSLTLASGTIAAYATAVICTAWIPRQPMQLAAALFFGAMTYGALGVVFGSLLRREVEGMFALVMTSLVDVGLQSPLASGGTKSAAVEFLPTYGTMQAATAAGFTHTALPGDLAVQILWFAGAALLGLFAFHRRTKRLVPVSPQLVQILRAYVDEFGTAEDGRLFRARAEAGWTPRDTSMSGTRRSASSMPSAKIGKVGRQAKWTRPHVFPGTLLAESLCGATKRDETRMRHVGVRLGPRPLLRSRQERRNDGPAERRTT